MSHPQQVEFVKKCKNIFQDSFVNKKVLEVGSLDINGSIRECFENCNYIGIDLAEGAGVDVVTSGQDASFSSNDFDMTISCNCFEHNPFWLETFINMCRMTKPGGLLLITSAGYGFREHGTSRTTPEDCPFTVEWDYYRNLGAKDFTKRINLKNWFSEWFFFHNAESKDLYFIGIKKTTNADQKSNKLDALKLQYPCNDRYNVLSNKLGHIVNKYYLYRMWRKNKLKSFKNLRNKIFQMFKSSIRAINTK